jgi:hypothetical protein
MRVNLPQAKWLPQWNEIVNDECAATGRLSKSPGRDLPPSNYRRKFNDGHSTT